MAELNGGLKCLSLISSLVLPDESYRSKGLWKYGGAFPSSVLSSDNREKPRIIHGLR
jgi:hypothetical protein